MNGVWGRIILLLLGVLLGYLAGFKDAQAHKQVVFMRVIERVQTFAERTKGEPAREREEAADRMGR